MKEEPQNGGVPPVEMTRGHMSEESTYVIASGETSKESANAEGEEREAFRGHCIRMV